MKPRAQVTIVADEAARRAVIRRRLSGAMRMSLSDTLVGKCDRRLDCPSFIRYSCASGGRGHHRRLYARRAGAAFAVPGALWCPRGGVAVRHVDAPPGMALALSLVRIPDFAISLPGVITWRAMERWYSSGAQPSKQRPFVIGGVDRG
jgi:hypothetical protein